MNSSRIKLPARCFSSEDKLIISPKAFLEPWITSEIIMRWAVKQREQSCVESWTGSKNICICHRGTSGLSLPGNVLHRERVSCFHVAIMQITLVSLGSAAGTTLAYYSVGTTVRQSGQMRKEIQDFIALFSKSTGCSWRENNQKYVFSVCFTGYTETLEPICKSSCRINVKLRYY